MRKFLLRISVIVVLIALFTYYIGRNLGTIKSTVHITFSQSLGLISLALLFAVIAFYFLVAMNQRVFSMLGIKRTILQMFLLQTQSLAMNVIVPSAGVSVGVVFASDAKDNGNSETAALTGVILALLVDYISISILLLVAIFYLYSYNELAPHIVVLAGAFFAVTFGLFLLIYLAGNDKNTLKRILDWAKRVANKTLVLFRRKPIVKNETVIDDLISELCKANGTIRKDPKSLVVALFFVLVSHLMYLISIYILFFSFGIDPLYRVLLTGYAVGVMMVVISPTPNGLGFVEGSMALVYTSMGIPGAMAAAVTLVYRGFCFWIPLFIGFFALQRKHLLDLITKIKK